MQHPFFVSSISECIIYIWAHEINSEPCGAIIIGDSNLDNFYDRKCPSRPFNGQCPALSEVCGTHAGIHKHTHTYKHIHQCTLWANHESVCVVNRQYHFTTRLARRRFRTYSISTIGDAGCQIKSGQLFISSMIFSAEFHITTRPFGRADDYAETFSAVPCWPSRCWRYADRD